MAARQFGRNGANMMVFFAEQRVGPSPRSRRRHHRSQTQHRTVNNEAVTWSTADLSMMQLKRMPRVFSRHVGCKEMPGLVARVSRGDCVHWEPLATLAFDTPGPMRRKRIFCIASLRKPVTA